MAITAVDICNLALSGLGDVAGISSIDPPDNSAQAHYCATYYPIAVRELLSTDSWSFATKRVILPTVTPDTKAWAYAHVVPSDYISAVAITDESGNEIAEFSQELHSSNVLVINNDVSVIELQYVSALTPVGVFPPPFVEALSLTLQYYLAGSIIKGDVGAAAKNSIYKLMATAVAAARLADSKHYRPKSKYVPTVALNNNLGISAVSVALGNNGPYVSGYTVA
jgi:hypothetical protein